MESRLRIIESRLAQIEYKLDQLERKQGQYPVDLGKVNLPKVDEIQPDFPFPGPTDP